MSASHKVQLRTEMASELWGISDIHPRAGTGPTGSYTTGRGRAIRDCWLGKDPKKNRDHPHEWTENIMEQGCMSSYLVFFSFLFYGTQWEKKSNDFKLLNLR
uniref:Uncharacterized protein n=1 Tax=Sphaerodactylus townsendi TaxID=933632 RepID=A0ACB8FZB1_9SAUR